MDNKLILSLVKDNEMEKELYAYEMNKMIRKKYSEADVEAILNNYLSDMSNEKYKAEFDALQEYRKACKELAKDVIQIK